MVYSTENVRGGVATATLKSNREDAGFRENCSIEDIKQLGESYRSVANNMSEKEAIAYLKEISDITSQYHVDYQQVLYELDINSKYTEV